MAPEFHWRIEMKKLSDEYRAEFHTSVEGRTLLTVTYVQPDTGLIFETTFRYYDDHAEVKFLVPLASIRKDTREPAVIDENQMADIRQIAVDKAAERYGDW